MADIMNEISKSNTLFEQLCYTYAWVNQSYF